MKRLELRGLIIIVAVAFLWVYLIIFWPPPGKNLIKSALWVLEGQPPLYVMLARWTASFLTLFGPVLLVSDLPEARRKKLHDRKL